MVQPGSAAAPRPGARSPAAPRRRRFRPATLGHGRHRPRHAGLIGRGDLHRHLGHHRLTRRPGRYRDGAGVAPRRRPRRTITSLPHQSIAGQADTDDCCARRALPTNRSVEVTAVIRIPSSSHAGSSPNRPECPRLPPPPCPAAYTRPGRPRPSSGRHPCTCPFAPAPRFAHPAPAPGTRPPPAHGRWRQRPGYSRVLAPSTGVRGARGRAPRGPGTQGTNLALERNLSIRVVERSISRVSFRNMSSEREGAGRPGSAAAVPDGQHDAHAGR